MVALAKKITTCNVSFSIQGVYNSFLDPVRREIKVVWIKKLLLPKLLASKTKVHWVNNYYILEMPPDTPPQFEQASTVYIVCINQFNGFGYR